MNSSDKPWPPLIVAGHVPRLVKWRDLLLTSILWVCFALLLGIEFELFLGGSLGLLDTDWLLFFERLKPYFLAAAIGILPSPHPRSNTTSSLVTLAKDSIRSTTSSGVGM